ncbi:tyrosine-type recombinase/integrase [Brevundimonas sp. Sa3CVA3]|uniref:Tyrosine-type recombinase/integrase n=2 Tax=Brevundimonas guildfordensis TaxID=2762241 RepID=A0ABR8R1J4_9CAUL|nr:tyrosine-type recombinase/integrase [Brevundimonas guildfordensis]
MAAYNAAVAERRAPKTDTLRPLAILYKQSPEFDGLGDSTKREWTRWLDVIMDDRSSPLAIGGLPFDALDDRRVKAEILAWRDQWADRPRKADYGIQVLSRVLSWGMDRGLLAPNAAAGIKQLYTSNRADQIWTADEIDRYTAAAKSPEVGFIVRLACLTGLRRQDLASLCWSHVGDLAIVKATKKSRGKKTAVIPLLDDTKELLDEIRAQQHRRHADLATAAERKNRPAPVRCLTVLSNTRGRPWSLDGLEHQVVGAKAEAGIDKHLHDARGTFATRLRRAGLTAAEIADILGWEEDRVQRLLAVYVDRDSIVMEIANRIRRNETATDSPN